jgi:hypothetical protein
VPSPAKKAGENLINSTSFQKDAIDSLFLRVRAPALQLQQIGLVTQVFFRP